MDAAIWTLFMYIGHAVSLFALVGLPVRMVQLLKGEFRRQYRQLVPWVKFILGLAVVGAFGVLIAACNAAYALYSYLHCNVGAGCAQGEFGVVFAFGMFGLAYALLESLLLPLALPVAKASGAQLVA